MLPHFSFQAASQPNKPLLIGNLKQPPNPNLPTMPTILLIRPENRLAPDIATCTAAGWQAIPFSPIRIAPIAETLFRLPPPSKAA